MNYILLIISLIISIIPIYLIGLYFYKKDTIKEPKKFLIKLFGSGIISGLIVLFISIFGIILFPQFTQVENIKNLFILLFYCFIFVATTEELSKLFMIYKISYNNKEFDQAYDIILYSVFVGLGFATFENIIYILGNNNISTAILRGITAVPAHVCFQTVMGYYLYQSKTSDKNKNIILSILFPITLHGIYDFIIFSQNPFSIFLIIILLLLFIISSLSLIKKLIKIDELNLKPYCPKCGNRIRYKYCSKCGHKKQ